MLAACVVAGCGGSSDDAPVVVTTTTTIPTVAAGRGVMTIGGERQSFTVESCVDGPAKGDTAIARQQFRLTGTGTADGVGYTVAITRYSSDTGSGPVNLTETAAFLTGTREAPSSFEAKRTKIGAKAWLDLNEPAAKTALIERRGTLVIVDATFGPQGSKVGDPELTPGTVFARCP